MLTCVERKENPKTPIFFLGGGRGWGGVSIVPMLNEQQNGLATHIYLQNWNPTSSFNQLHICCNTNHRESSLRWIKIINMNNTWKFSYLFSTSCAAWPINAESDPDLVPSSLDGNTKSWVQTSNVDRWYILQE